MADKKDESNSDTARIGTSSSQEEGSNTEETKQESILHRRPSHPSGNERPTPDHDSCMQKLGKTLQHSGRSAFLREKIEELGCHLPLEAFQCRPCGESGMSGGWRTTVDKEGKLRPEIILCEDNKLPQRYFHQTVAHELVHAYDQCKMKVDWRNCLHHACTEVRASNTSGECNMKQEWMRGKFQWANGHKECVKRRAGKSLTSNPYCGDKAQDYVASVFEACYKDVEPYDKNPWW